MNKTALAFTLLAIPTLSFAGAIHSNEGAALAMTCTAGPFGKDSIGLSCTTTSSYTRYEWVLQRQRCKTVPALVAVDVQETIANEYWMPITNVQRGDVILDGDSLKVDGIICTETECIGLSDKFQILARDGSTATVLYRSQVLEITIEEMPDEGLIRVGSPELGYFVMADL